MNDFYLKFPDAQAFDEVKGAVPFDYEQGGSVQSPGWSVDVLGDGLQKVVAWDAEGEPTFAPVEGYLVNLRSAGVLPEPLVQYQVFPATPIRVWA